MRRMVRVEVQHLRASVGMLGQHTLWSSVASASDIRTSLAVGLSLRPQAQFTATMLTNDGRGFPAWTACRGGVAVRTETPLRS